MAVLSLKNAVLRLFRRSKDAAIFARPCGQGNKSLRKAAERVAAEFECSPEDVRKAVKEFMREMNEGLQIAGSTMEQIPSYVTAVPTGHEKGTYLAVDLGGTNLRVCSVTLNGDGTHSMIQSKVAIPTELMVSESAKGLFVFLATQIQKFLQTHHSEELIAYHSASDGKPLFSLGFTFSYAVTQLAINRGDLIRWSKGFNIDDVVGKDVCLLLQDELDDLKLPVKVTALVNDTVGTLMARAYAASQTGNTVLGAVFGTGTNGAYVEKLSNITKLESTGSNYDPSATYMIVNTEWGNFDSQGKVLPSTAFDLALDRGSLNPGFEKFEKLISGMYLGEILRLAILSLVNNPDVSLFSASTISKASPLYSEWAIDSEILSVLEGDKTADLLATKSHLSKAFELTQVTFKDAEAVKLIAHAIGKRSARLSAVAVGAVVLQTNCLGVNDGGIIDIGVDGSLIECYPGFEEEMRGALRDIDEIGKEGEKRISIAVAKDGSGVGAALTAHMAAMQETSRGENS